MRLGAIFLLFIFITAFLASGVLAVSISISTNKNAYKRGEKVFVTGSISGADSYPVSFIWEAKDSEGRRIDLGQETTDSNGKFSFSFVIKSTSSLGKAIIIISCLGTTASKSFYIKEQSSLSISASPPSATIGDKIVISGSLTPKIQGATIKILIFSGGSWTELATATTNSDGKYSYTWTANKEGTYRFKAQWDGNDKYFKSTSNEVTVKVSKPSKPKANLVIIANATEINLGEAVKIRGSMTPAKDTEVTLQYKDPDGEILKFKLSVVNGKFSHVFKPNKMGKWTVKAIWPGDEQYGKTESNTVSIVVKKKASSIRLNIYPSKIEVYDLVKINGTLYPPLENEELKILITEPSGIEFQYQILTGENGTYFFNFKVNSSGTWNIEISWSGNQIYSRCRINKSFIVYKKFSNVTLHFNKTVYVEGEKVEIKGVLNPKLEDEEIKIKVSMNNGKTWQELATVKTGKDGEFLFIWQPENASTYLVSAEWNGNNIYLNASTIEEIEVFKSFKESSIKIKDSKVELLIFSNVSILEYKINPEVLSINLKLKTESIIYLKIYVEKLVYELYNASPSSTFLLLKEGTIQDFRIGEEEEYFILEYLLDNVNNVSDLRLVIVSWNLKLKILDSENKPLPQAHIILQSLSEYPLNYSAISDSNGEATFSNVPGGYYNITVYYWGVKVGEENIFVKDNISTCLSTRVGFYKEKYDEMSKKYEKLETEYENLAKKYNDLEKKYQKLINEKFYLTIIVILLFAILIFITVSLVREYFK